MFQFNLPLLGRPILWYGFFFATGFFLGYWVLIYLLKHLPEKDVKIQVKTIAEKLTFYVIVGMLIGARVADVLFYQDPSLYLRDPLSIVKFWEGGLASHGGAAGILIALWLFSRKYQILSWSRLLDLIVIPAGLVGFFIRLGNFVNQEVLGKVTSLPWAVVFGHPIDHSPSLPRHPVQLYEALYYLTLFFFFFWLFRRRRLKKGQIGGLFLVLVFTFRFAIEFLKEEQSALMGAQSLFDMGQLLSLPLLGVGIYLWVRKKSA